MKGLCGEVSAKEKKKTSSKIGEKRRSMPLT